LVAVGKSRSPAPINIGTGSGMNGMIHEYLYVYSIKKE
jgi:hypothetical protein